MDLVKSVRRTCEIFELFYDLKRPLSLKEVMDRFDYPASSCSSLLKSLVVMGYLEYDLNRRTYFPTMRMNGMVDWIERARFGNGSVLAAMRQLHQITSETVSLGTQSDLHAQYVHQIPGILPLPYPRLRQTVRPLARSGLGWLLLSSLDDAMIDHLAKRINHAEQYSRNRIEIGELMKIVYKIRKDGFIFSKNTVVPGAGMIGMLIPKEMGSKQLALSVHGPVSRLEEKEKLILENLAAVTTAAGILGSD